MSVTFGLPILLRFLYNPCFVCQYPHSLLRNISSLYHRWLYLYVAMERARRAWMRGGGRGHTGEKKNVRRFACKVIMVRNLLCQPKAWCWVSVQIPVPQGTGELSPADHVWVWPRDRNWNPTVNPDSQVQNGLIYFWCHESTKIRKYDQGLPT